MTGQAPLNTRVLKKLRDHLAAHHAGALADMHRAKFGYSGTAQEVADEWFRLDMLNDACTDPTRFPVHVLADKTVVDLIKRVRRADRWSFAAEIGRLL
ncbi:MAG: hypothetical protein AAGM84_18575, partial [Pseudomonadota bacterium]